MIKCNLRNVSDAVRAKEEFICNATLSGKWQPANKINFGWIEDESSLKNHLVDSINFVVYSYDTPIAVYIVGVGGRIPKSTPPQLLVTWVRSESNNEPCND